MKTLGYLGTAAAFLALSAVLGYCWDNDSGHGPNLHVCLLGFCPLFALGLGLTFAPPQRWIGLSLALISGLGMLFSWSAAPLRLMMGYEAWIDAGMPEPHPDRVPIIAGVFAASLVALGLSLIPPRREAS